MNVAFCSYGIQLRQIIDLFPASNPSCPVYSNLPAVKSSVVVEFIFRYDPMACVDRVSVSVAAVNVYEIGVQRGSSTEKTNRGRVVR